jgi:hypothetical protein
MPPQFDARAAPQFVQFRALTLQKIDKSKKETLVWVVYLPNGFHPSKFCTPLQTPTQPHTKCQLNAKNTCSAAVKAGYNASNSHSRF